MMTKVMKIKEGEGEINIGRAQEKDWM